MTNNEDQKDERCIEIALERIRDPNRELVTWDEMKNMIAEMNDKFRQRSND